MNPQSTAQQIWYIPRLPKKDLFSKQDDVLTAAEKYIEEHGTEAFERLITKVINLFKWVMLIMFYSSLLVIDFGSG